MTKPLRNKCIDEVFDALRITAAYMRDKEHHGRGARDTEQRREAIVAARQLPRTSTWSGDDFLVLDKMFRALEIFIPRYMEPCLTLHDTEFQQAVAEDIAFCRKALALESGIARHSGLAGINKVTSGA